MLVAVLLGIIEGLTEFLPVSSTGHLIIAGHLLNFTGPKAASFEVFIQLGAILAVVWFYRQTFIDLISRRTKTGFHGRHGLQLLAYTMLPAVLVGALLHSFIKTYLFNPMVVAISLGIGGIAILILESRHLRFTTLSLDNISRRQALRIGLFQLLALIPGVSRAAATILGGMGVGLNRETAVQYSFLAAVPLMLAATGYDMVRSWPLLAASDVPFFVAGFVTAFITATLAIQFFLKFVKTSDFRPFGWYRIGLSVVVLAVIVVR